MESLNFIKGYDKVNPSKSPKPSPPNNHSRRKLIAISLAILLTVVIGSLIAVLIQKESEESDPSELASNSAESLRTVCSVTRYPGSCFSSISPLNTPPINDPLRFFNLSLRASMIEVSSLRNVSGSSSEPGLKDCAELFDDSASQLNRSAALICVGPGEKVLTEMTISDLQTWISAAMTDQETCIDGLEEMGSTAVAVAEFKMKVHKSQEYMSNTLAILNNIPSLFKKFGIKML